MNAPEFGTIRRAFTDLADTMVGDFDILVFLDTLTGYCADLLPVTACGAMSDAPALVSASTENARAMVWLPGSRSPCGRTITLRSSLAAATSIPGRVRRSSARGTSRRNQSLSPARVVRVLCRI